jgi:hypothetical protein
MASIKKWQDLLETILDLINIKAQERDEKIGYSNAC